MKKAAKLQKPALLAEEASHKERDIATAAADKAREAHASATSAKEQAASALQILVLQNVANQLAIVNEAVAMLKAGSAEAQEHVTQLLRNLAQDPDNRSAIAKAGAVPELVRQLECGSEKAMGMAASGLALIALKSAEHRATVHSRCLVQVIWGGVARDARLSG